MTTEALPPLPKPIEDALLDLEADTPCDSFVEAKVATLRAEILEALGRARSAGAARALHGPTPFWVENEDGEMVRTCWNDTAWCAEHGQPKSECDARALTPQTPEAQ